MTLTLTIEGGGRLENGARAELVLNRRGAIIGRASTCDWPLPDPTRHISSRHLEIRYDGGAYLLTDKSTNGTTLAGSGERLSSPHRIMDGDRFQLGPYIIAARLTGDAGRPNPEPEAQPGWSGWDTPGPAAPTAAPATNDGWAARSHSDWDMPPARADTGERWQPRLGPSLARPEAHRGGADWGSAPASPPSPSAWAPGNAAPPPSVSSAWEAQTPPPDPASGWSSAATDRPPAASPDELWGMIAEGNVVDWARGGFGQPVEPAGDPLGVKRAPAADSLPPQRPNAPEPIRPAAPAGDGVATAFLTAIGLDAAKLNDSGNALDRAAPLLKRLVAGMVVMLEARARAKAQLGAEATAFNPDGHNPLKFARTPDDALAMMLDRPQSGFMAGERAVEDAFEDLQSHQVATLRAMQGALKATLERFSPAAIRARADAGGMIERILPTARDAALWQAYEREFGGVAQGSDEAFLDMFAKEFRQAYNEQARHNRP